VYTERTHVSLASPPRWVAGGATLVIWALAVGSALFWGLRGTGGLPVDARLAGGADAGEVRVDPRAVARALGAADGASASAAAPAPDVLRRLALRGIVTHEGRGAALISIDGKAPKPVRKGAALEGLDGWAVRALTPRSVVVAAGEREATLDMPPLDQRASARDAEAPRVPPVLPSPPLPGAVVPPAQAVEPPVSSVRMPHAYPARARRTAVRG
jgi:general secretion pathway protein C